MIKILNKRGITQLFPIQYETFNIIHKGEDVIAKDRTGSGKTFAFALPMIVRMREQQKFKGSHYPKFLIVLPTRYT
jgi:ATP-dependent RNA helicase DDX21